MIHSAIIPALLRQAQVVAMKSNDPRTKVGAVILCRDGVVRAEGYNHIVDEDYAHVRVTKDHEAITKYDVVVHAEMHALLSYRGKIPHACIVTHIPCVRCASHLIWAGVKEIYWGEENITAHLGSEKTTLLLKKHRINHGRIIL
jgi:dCMP deaminase